VRPRCKKQWSDYAALGLFLAVRISSDVILTGVHSASGLSSKSILHINYFYTYWISSALESVLTS